MYVLGIGFAYLSGLVLSTVASYQGDSQNFFKRVSKKLANIRKFSIEEDGD